MATYVDLYLLALPRKNLAAYRRMARMAGKVFRRHGATEYREFVADDMTTPGGGIMAFTKLMKARRGEIVIGAVVGFPSKAVRDRGMKSMMQDPAMQAPQKPIFDMKRMVYGGFKTLVEI
jgi:uncharacterized protein YbaA (DUF1428 family)